MPAPFDLAGHGLVTDGRLISPFEAAAAYAFAGTGSGIALNSNPALVRQGLGSLAVTCNRGSAAPTNVRTIHALSVLARNGRFGCFVHIPDYTLLVSIVMAVYSTYPTDFYFQTYNLADADKQFNGWHWISLARDQFGGTTGTPDWDTKPFVTFELRFNQAGAAQVVCHMDACYALFKARPKLVIYADDGYASWFDLGIPLMNARQLRASHAIIGSLIDTATYMTSANLAALYAQGHDMVVHGATDLSALADTAARAADILANQSFLLGKGFARGAYHYVYPNGVYQLSAGNQEILGLLRARGMLTARTTTTPRNWNHAYGLGDRDLVLPIIGGVSTDTPAALLSRLDLAIARGDNSAVMFHRIVAGAPGSSIEYQDTALATFLDGVKTRVDAGLLDVVTVSDYWAGYSAQPGNSTGIVRTPVGGLIRASAFGGIG